MATSTPSLGADLHALVSMIDRAASRALSPDGEVTYRRYVVLTGIAQLGVPTQHALAEHLGLSDPAVSRMLATLTDAGLVTAAPDPAHRRRHTVRLTPEGAAVEARLGRRLDAAMTAMLGAVGIDEGVFGADVARLRQGFRAWLDRPGTADAAPATSHADPAPEPAPDPAAHPAPEPAFEPAP